jgi:hypothetical protein
MEFYSCCTCVVGFLEQVLLRLALIAGLFFLGLAYLFHKVAFAIAMQPWFVAVNAQIGGNVVPVQLKARVFKQAREIGGDKGNNKRYSKKPLQHTPAKVYTEAVLSKI